MAYKRLDDRGRRSMWKCAGADHQQIYRLYRRATGAQRSSAADDLRGADGVLIERVRVTGHREMRDQASRRGTTTAGNGPHRAVRPLLPIKGRLPCGTIGERPVSFPDRSGFDDQVAVFSSTLELCSLLDFEGKV